MVKEKASKVSQDSSSDKNKTKSLTMDSQDSSIFRIPPYYYLHVLDQNSNVTRVIIGPLTFIRQDNERVILGPEKMIVVPPIHYCVIENPVSRDANGNVVFGKSGQVKLQHANLDIRLFQEPFPLYPGESLKQAVTALKIIPADSALRLRCILDFVDDDKNSRIAGDEWLFEGPGTYIPRKEVTIEETIRATIIQPNQALKLKARRETLDRDGKLRVTGEQWVVKRVGAYLPGAYEDVVEILEAYVLTEKKALHIRATGTFTDENSTVRRNGEEWLITMENMDTYIPDIFETVVEEVPITTLNNREYCVILDPVGSDGKPQLGRKRLVKGEKSFFLRPGEKLENGIQKIYILSENEGLILKAMEGFLDSDQSVQRSPGDRWMIRGPKEYIPPVEVEVVTQRKAIPLDENEGIYVRDIKTGKVRAVCGETYMLTQDEELWAKEMPHGVEDLLNQGRDPLADRGLRGSGAATLSREKTKVVTFRVPRNAAVQIYDYKEKKARVIFGPDLVMLLPDEQFTQLSLSGGKPKKPNAIKALCLLLGPDFCTDIIIVETADHARLQLQLSYNWHFEASSSQSIEEVSKIFSVPDFIGDACKAMASRIRGAVAGVQFDDFHKNSARIIQTSVFGIDDNMKIRNNLKFPQNNLCITSVDIQSVEPVDQRTRDALMKSVQLAIEITTNSQEATARHEAERLEQEAKGRLERQKITDEAEAERARRNLLELQAQSAAVESTGQAKAEAQSRAEASKIEGETAVEQATLKAKASKIDSESELERLEQARQAELKYLQQTNELEIEKLKQQSQIETEKFKQTVAALGTDTLRSIAIAGPEFQVKLLQSLGLQSTLITDGCTPINLFSTAEGLLGQHLFTKKRKCSESEA